MTSTMVELYWLTRLIYMHDVFGDVFGWTCALGGIGTVILVLTELGAEDKDLNNKRWILRTIWGIMLFLWVLSGLVTVFTPTKEEAAFIVAGGAVVAAAQSDAGHRLADKSVAVLEGSLDTILGKEAVAKAQLDVQKKIVDAVKQQMGVKDDGKGTNNTASSGS